MVSDVSKLLSPLCLRLTLEERAQLEMDAAGKSLSSYVRSRLFDGSLPQRKTRGKRPVKDQQALSRLLAALGNAKLANNLNQLAKAAHSGSLPVTPETETDIKQAYEGVLWMRQTLISALSLQPTENP